MGAAKAQGTANLDAARLSARLSNPNVTNPLGTQTVTWGGAPSFDETGYNAAMAGRNAGGGRWVPGDTENPTRWEQDAPGAAPTREQFTTYGDQPNITQTLTPQGQSLFDQQLRISQSLGDTAESGLDRVRGSTAQPFSLYGLPNRVTDIGRQDFTSNVNAAPVRFDTGYNQPIQYGLGDAGQIQRGIGDAGQIRRGIGNAGNIQGGLDYSGAPRLPGVDDFSADRQRVEEALMSRLTPQFGRDEEALRTRLSNSGLMPGTQAWNTEMDALNRGRTDARMQAILAGGGEQSRLFGLGLGARQQAVGETTTAGQFANQAQGQQFGQNLAGGQFANTAQQQAYNQLLNSGNFANTAQAQAFGQQLAGGNFANQAQAQGYGQAQGNLAAYNAAQGQQFGQGLQGANLQNQVAQARIAEALSNAGLANQGRQNEIQEQMLVRNQPLAELNALRTGAQPTMPQFQPYQGANVAPAPIMQATGQQAAWDQNLYNQGVGQQNALTSGLFGIGQAGMYGWNPFGFGR
ncbi:MAG: hypothetical protein NUV51_03920 [Sulfuricaulis sp.]|nr:hypothetical protein [Sulfuricaulis sp.]